MELLCPPDYLPEPPFWAAALRSSRIRLVTGAQYVRQTRHNRARIRTPQGSQWLTIPVRRGQLGSSIAETRLSPEGAWWRQHQKALQYNYGNAAYFGHLMPEIAPYLTEQDSLAAVSVPLIKVLAAWLGCTADIEIESAALHHGLFDHGEELTPRVALPRYRQAFEGFETGLSALDLLMNHGPSAREIILSGSTLVPKYQHS